jgi:hypothetical protein
VRISLDAQGPSSTVDPKQLPMQVSWQATTIIFRGQRTPPKLRRQGLTVWGYCATPSGVLHTLEAAAREGILAIVVDRAAFAHWRPSTAVGESREEETSDKGVFACAAPLGATRVFSHVPLPSGRDAGAFVWDLEVNHTVCVLVSSVRDHLEWQLLSIVLDSMFFPSSLLFWTTSLISIFLVVAHKGWRPKACLQAFRSREFEERPCFFL